MKDTIPGSIFQSDASSMPTRPDAAAPANVVRLDKVAGKDGTGATESSAFQSILFPAALEHLRAKRSDMPACFVDLNLDQIVTAILAKHDQEALRPIFYSPCRNETVVRYRQAVFADLQQPAILRGISAFRTALDSMRSNFRYAEEIRTPRHHHIVFLRAAGLYCAAVPTVLNELRAADPRSAGLKAFSAYLAEYTVTPAFAQLAKETRDLREALAAISYGMLFHSDKVTVRKYASEPDYAATILARFARFRETDVARPAPPQPRDDFSLNHIEAAILEFVGRLFPEQFRRLDDFVARHAGFVDEIVAAFDREIGFFVAYLEFISPLKSAGLPFCYPDVSVAAKHENVVGSFDLALAGKLMKEKGAIVRNDFHLAGSERLMVVSGPNQGGKTTFARMFGQLHFLAGLGCPVPGEAARLFLPDEIYAHFEREEDITNLRGKLEDELVRLHQTCTAITADSVIILNEIFNSTSFDDQVFLGTRVLQQILESDAIGVCVTFVDALSTLSEKTVSMVSTVEPDDPARRTFKVVRRQADGLAYALSLAEKHRVTYEQLRTRVRP